MKKGVAFQISEGLRARVETSIDGETWATTDLVDGFCLVDLDLSDSQMKYRRIYIEDKREETVSKE